MPQYVLAAPAEPEPAPLGRTRSSLVPLAVMILVALGALSSATITFAVGGSQPVSDDAEPPKAPPLVVPKVLGAPYVFAKGILDDGGFAWRVNGAVQGFAANLVSVQQPAPGTKLVDNGRPTIALRLERNPDYPENGLPENSSPHAGSPAVRASAGRAARPKPSTLEPAEPAEPAPAKKPRRRRYREPDFRVAGAPREPAKEIPLTERAFLLSSWLVARARPTPAALRHWRYQHAWILTGARFGWRDGADALRVLIAVDRDVLARWHVGRAELVEARAALREVRRKSK